MRFAGIMLIAGCGFHGPAAAEQIESAPDAAAAFDAASCPSSYRAALPGPTRYRVLTDGHPAWIHSDTCAADLPGATHLVILSSAGELAAIAALVSAPPAGIAGNAIWVGGVQLLSAAEPGDGWLGFDGNPLLVAWGGAEPNDRGNGEGDHDEQFVKLERNRAYLSDASGGDNLGALCECDGQPIAATAATAIAAARLPR